MPAVRACVHACVYGVCAGGWVQAYEMRGAGAVIHSHSLNAVMATMLEPDCNEFHITHVEMIKVRRAPRHTRSQMSMHAEWCSNLKPAPPAYACTTLAVSAHVEIISAVARPPPIAGERPDLLKGVPLLASRRVHWVGSCSLA